MTRRHKNSYDISSHLRFEFAIVMLNSFLLFRISSSLFRLKLLVLSSNEAGMNLVISVSFLSLPLFCFLAPKIKFTSIVAFSDLPITSCNSSYCTNKISIPQFFLIICNCTSIIMPKNAMTNSLFYWELVLSGRVQFSAARQHLLKLVGLVYTIPWLMSS